MPPPIRLALQPLRAIRVERNPDQPVRLERLTQDAPVLRLAGVMTLLAAGSGATTGIDREASAEQMIPGHRAVSFDGSGGAWLAEPGSSEFAGIGGVSSGAATSGALATVRLQGVLEEPSWNWSEGPIWVGAEGALTQVLPTSGYLVRAGIALAPTVIHVDPLTIAKL